MIILQGIRKHKIGSYLGPYSCRFKWDSTYTSCLKESPDGSWGLEGVLSWRAASILWLREAPASCNRPCRETLPHLLRGLLYVSPTFGHRLLPSDYP